MPDAPAARARRCDIGVWRSSRARCTSSCSLGPYGCCLCYAPRAFWEGAQPLEQHDRNRTGAPHGSPHVEAPPNCAAST
eukprot:5827193-Prymnesium_polylepis.1